MDWSHGFIILLLALSTVWAKDGYLKRTPEIQIRQGKLQGIEMTSRGNRIFSAFRGIPFAEPPIGELRFRAPVPSESWDGVFDATKDGNICKQKNTLFHQQPPIEGSEDCLYLNVYTPMNLQSGDLKNGNLLPVMVFIHYGGFFCGSSRSDLLGPQFLMDKDVILVSFNYRLGIFGFYSTLDDEAPGNFALKDQVLALKWVQENIEAFGGDKNKVTIFGQSAGAGSVHHHILSPSSRGLFHQAISESGSALSLWAKPFNDVQKVIFPAIAQAVGCDPAGNTKTIIECMRNADADVLISASDTFKYFSIEPLTVFTFVIEKKTAANPEPFLTEDPTDIITSGNFAKVPWIMGVTSNEGVLRSSPLIRQAETLNILNENFHTYLPQMMSIVSSVSENNTAELWKNIVKYYMLDNNIQLDQPETLQGLTNLYSDRSFLYGTYQSALYHNFKGHKPIWFYHMDYKSSVSYGNVFAATNETVDFDWGVSHCDELLYLFPSPQILPELPAEDLIMSKTLIKMWTNFAIYGKPTTSANSSTKQCGWTPLPDMQAKYPMKNIHLHYLNISKSANKNDYPVKLEMRNEFYPERMAFWESQPLHENIPGIE